MDIHISVKLSDDSAEMRAHYLAFDDAIDYLEHLKRHVERLEHEARHLNHDF